MPESWASTLEDGSSIGVVEVTPVNLSLLTEGEAGGVHHAFRGLLQGVDFPLYLYSVQEDLDLLPYAEYLKDRFSLHREMWEDYLKYWSTFDAEDLVATRHFVATHHHSGASSVLKQILNDGADGGGSVEVVEKRVKQIRTGLNRGKLSARPVTLEDLRSELPRHFEAGSPSARYVSTEPEYRRMAVITDYPTQLSLAWPLDLLRVRGKVDVAQRIEPLDLAGTRQRLNKLKERLGVEIDSRLGSNIFDTEPLQKALDDVEWMLDELVGRDQYPFHHSVYVTVHGDTREKCDETWSRLSSQLDELGVGYREPVFQTDYALQTQSITGPDQLREDYLWLSDSAAAALPFATRPLEQEAGIIYGEGLDRTPVVLDRFTWHSPHLARFGAAGGGKSFHAGLEMIRAFLAYPDIQIVVVDLKNDFDGIIKRFGGEVLSVEDRPSELGRATTFQVPERGQQRYIDEAVDLIEHLHTLTAQNPGQRTLAVVDEAHNFTEPDDTRDSGGTGRGLRLLSKWLRESRDTSTAVTVISQSAADFTDYSQGRKLLEQCPGKVFFRHERVSPSMVDYFDLSQQEVYEIKELQAGDEDFTDYSEAVLKVSTRFDAKIRVVATPAEQKLIEQQQ